MRGKRDFENGLYEDYNDQVLGVLYPRSDESRSRLICFVLRMNWICCPSWSKEGAERQELALLGCGDNWKWDSVETLGFS